jgi:cell division protein FtsB
MGSSLRAWFLRILLAASLAVAIGFLPYRLYGEDGIGRTRRLEEDLAQLLRRNQRLASDNDLLKRRIQLLKEQRPSVEQVARDELGLVKNEDVVFLFEVRKPSPPRSGRGAGRPAGRTGGGAGARGDRE